MKKQRISKQEIKEVMELMEKAERRARANKLMIMIGISNLGYFILGLFVGAMFSLLCSL